jgi:hypothetical protein
MIWKWLLKNEIQILHNNQFCACLMKHKTGNIWILNIEKHSVYLSVQDT